MQNEQKSPMLNQPNNEPMSYGDGVSPANAKRSDTNATPSPSGKSTAPWQAGHGSGKSTDGASQPSRTNPGSSAKGPNTDGNSTNDGAPEKHTANLG